MNKKFGFALPILAAALLSSVLFSVIAPNTVHALGPPASVIEVHPSGDMSGATDHTNIQNAMDALEPGGKVVLSDGHFYINAGIVVEGFNGTLEGSTRGKKLQTTLEAIAPFSYTHATNYLPFDPVLPSVLFFEFPEGELIVKDLIFQALAPAYVEARPYYGTALTHFIADFGGDVDVTYKNLKLIAAQGDLAGSNVAFGIHSMRGPACEDPCDRRGNSSLHGTGHAVFTEIETSNLVDYTIAAMWYRDGSLKFSDISGEAPVGVWGSINMDTDVASIHIAASWRAIWLGWVFGGHTRVSSVLAEDGVCPAILFEVTENVELRDSQVSGCNGFGAWWRNPIFLPFFNRNISIVDNVIDGVTGTGAAIGILESRNNAEIVIRDNYYDPSYFTGPPGAWAVYLGSDDSLVVEPSLTPEQVLDLGENNTLKLGKD